jgi:hypothetical protein
MQDIRLDRNEDLDTNKGLRDSMTWS